MFKPVFPKKAVLVYSLAVLGIFFVIQFFIYKESNYQQDRTSQDTESATGSSADLDEDGPIPYSVTTSLEELAVQPRDMSALGGYNVLIADRGNNRLIEVTPDKKIVWEYKFDLPKLGLGADDSFFADNGKDVVVNLEMYHVVELINYQTKQVIWTYGIPGKPGRLAGELNTPDDAYKLPNGDIIVADIKNCRVIEVNKNKQIVHQYGQTKKCQSNKIGSLNEPNGDTPLTNGHILISTIKDRNLVELNEKWQPIFTMELPVGYPSDPQATRAGNILISDYRNPGQIVEVSRQGKVVWQYMGEASTTLNKPSLAIELPNGNILANDDFNHRVIVIDKASKKIIWQYGVTGKPGKNAGQLSIPDGMDIIKHDSPASNPTLTSSVSQIVLPLHMIGQVTRHAQNFASQQVRVQGYLLKKEKGYIIFSDEAGGIISSYDLPVIGQGIDLVEFKKKYILEGRFVKDGLVSSNNNLYHLELTKTPQLVK